MKRRALIILTLMFGIPSVLVANVEAARSLLALRPYVETTQSVVTLRDLLVNPKALVGFDASASSQTVLHLYHRKEKRFSLQEVYQSLHALFPEYEDLPFRIPRGGIRVKRVFRIDKARVVRVFKETIRHRFGKIGSIKVRELRLLGNPILPSSSYRIVPVPPARLQKVLSLKLKLKGDSWERTLFARGKIAIITRVLIARTTIPKGERLDDTNTALVEEDTTCLHVPYFTDLNQCQGQVAKRTIPSGRIVTRDIVTAPILVHRGEVVTIKVQTPHMLITTLAIAKQPGKFGDIIRVENIQSKKTIYAKVTSKHLVTVEF